jgi:prepilin-type N-terminal cleavage/methylation domain-containing protein
MNYIHIAPHTTHNQKAFTLIELLITIGLTTILMTIIVIALVRPQSKASVQATTNLLAADLQQQQLTAMLGDSGSQSTSQPQGMRITTSKYTLFTGPAFSGSTNNFDINFPQGITLTGVTLPLDIIFARRSGETTTVNNLIITDGVGDSRAVSISSLGVVNIN